MTKEDSAISTVNLDMLVSAGRHPWRPAAEATDVDVWDRFDFPTSGTYRLSGRLIIFALVTTAGGRSLWAYVPVPPEQERAVQEARFDSDAHFDAFVAGCFAERTAVFAVAQDFVIEAKSGGVTVGPGRWALLAAASQWYFGTRAAALAARSDAPMDAEAGAEGIQRATQELLASAPA